MAARSMLKPDEVRNRAQKRFDRHYRSWAKLLFEREARLTDAQAPDTESFSVSLSPPTEKQVLADPSAARTWAAAWRSCSFTPLVYWESRQWASVGNQDVPCRVIMSQPEDIAAVADRSGDWDRLSTRVRALAQAWMQRWRPQVQNMNADELSSAVQSVAARILEASEEGWRICMAVLDWFVEHPNTSCYVRQLPIRGIDTKWMERHRALVDPLVRAIVGKAFSLKTPPTFFRIHVLDEGLRKRGISLCSLPSDELEHLEGIFRSVIVCENLVSTLALPPIPKTLAIHGGGFAVGDLGHLSWLATTPVFYWGDLDSNGFAILNQFRSHLPQLRSVLMDAQTLEHHADLCVEEPKPSLSVLPYLSENEIQVLKTLRAGDATRGISSLRLEQERIEWQWACAHLFEALDGDAC